MNYVNENRGVWVRHIARTQNSDWSADVRFAAHNGLTADVALCPKSANNRRSIYRPRSHLGTTSRTP
jgi:hypothetical protein